VCTLLASLFSFRTIFCAPKSVTSEDKNYIGHHSHLGENEHLFRCVAKLEENLLMLFNNIFIEKQQKANSQIGIN